ncbi:MAG: peptidylprolyl isomerase [Kastovskya adunca ATA6-11-RM4]|jgi:parvulin-like peptidyl-prolyl isomerase|nr:peptidylprolyl isomerase [Kastovskya adunca ATA6-11-RM4]
MISLSKEPIQPEEILSFLKKKICFKEICQEILQQQIVDRVAQEKGIAVTPEEIQTEAEHTRREKHLEKASDTLAWLAEQMITPEDWEAGIRDRLITQKLAEDLLSKEVEKYFAQNRLDFDQVLLYQIVVPYEKIAYELFYQIEEQEISFYEAAHLYDLDERRRHQCGYEGILHRWSLKPDVAAVVFSSSPGEITRPLKTEQGYHIFLVEEFMAAELTPQLTEEIRQTMFLEWQNSELNYLLYNQS